MKHILHWNEAYGDKTYGLGFGREPFYTHVCPETRCVTTEDRHRGKSLASLPMLVFTLRPLQFSERFNFKKINLTHESVLVSYNNFYISYSSLYFYVL